MPVSCWTYLTAGPPDLNTAADGTDCGVWLGPDVNAVACDAQLLSRTLRHAGQGKATTTLRAAGSRSGALAGLAQSVGSPLRAGQTMRVRGRPTRGMQLAVRAKTGDGTAVALFTRLPARGGRVTIPKGRSAAAIRLDHPVRQGDPPSAGRGGGGSAALPRPRAARQDAAGGEAQAPARALPRWARSSADA